jgi:phage baseplate assembly protein W
MARVRGVRFAGLAEDDPSGLGLSATPSGGLAMREGTAVVRQSLMMLLATIPGERVMRPDYGCPLHRVVFLPNDATTAGLAIHYVRSAIIRFEPRVEILRLDAGPEPDAPHRLKVELDYRVRANLQTDRIELGVDLAGGAG